MAKQVPIQSVPIGAKVRTGTGRVVTLIRLGVGSAEVEIKTPRHRDVHTAFGTKSFDYEEKAITTWSLNTPVEVVL